MGRKLPFKGIALNPIILGFLLNTDTFTDKLYAFSPMLKNLLNRITRHFLFRNEIPQKTFAEFEQEISQKNILGKTFSEIEKELNITKTEMDMIPPFASLRLKKDDVNFERTRKEFDKVTRRLGLDVDRAARAESAIPSQ